MPTRIESDVAVPRFGFVHDDKGNRLLFPRAEMQTLEGKSGGVGYGAAECLFERLEGRLGALLWKAETASLGRAWLRDDAGRFDIAIDRVEMPSGVQLTRAQSGVELLSPQVSFSEMRLAVNGPFGRGAERPAPPPSSGAPALRQETLRFLDSLTGRIYLTVKVVLDLPVLGRRTLDQELKLPIQEGLIDFRALEDSLDWLEGKFIDIEAEGDRLVLSFKVPIFGSARELISWHLEHEAATVASFGKVPVRALADFRTGRSGSGGTKSDDKGKRKILQALAIEGIDIAIGLLAPRSLEVGNGLIMFGGDDQPGLVDLKVAGGIRDSGPGKLTGAIGSIDTTIKDLRLGPVLLSADRLHFDGLDGLEVTFDGFKPAKLAMVVHRVTATNLAMRIGGER